MDAGAPRGKAKSDINVTPLIDIVLVLLIHWAAPPIAGTSPLLSLTLPVTMLLLVSCFR